jgi:hypothetical protein
VNPAIDTLVLMQLHVWLKQGQQRSKLIFFNYEEKDVRGGKPLLWEECAIHRPLLQALWHPFYSDYVLVLT